MEESYVEYVVYSHAVKKYILALGMRPGSCAYADHPRQAKKFPDIIAAMNHAEAYQEFLPGMTSIVMLRTRFEPPPNI